MLMVLAGAPIGAGVGLAWLAFRATPSSPADAFEADSFRLERVHVVTVRIPNPEVEKGLEAVKAAVPLDDGHFDPVTYLNAPGLEPYRTRQGSKAGVQDEANRNPMTRVSVSIPRDAEAIAKVLVASRRFHPYDVPVCTYIHEAWRNRTTCRDENNPDRWWNRNSQQPHRIDPCGRR